MRAQRLSASKVLSLCNPESALRNGVCAQRLSASKVLSRAVHLKTLLRMSVLNAFRHQRFFHVRRGRPRGVHRIVLNAFRHQRFFHSAYVHIGVGETNVLNAFRHQRFFHGRYILRRCCACRCSTPFGIKGSFTWKTDMPGLRTGGAQRLSASKVLSRPGGVGLLVRFGVCAQRLSASKVLSRIIKSGTTSVPFCAQRLSASKVLSPRLSCAPVPAILVLNAFRHQRFFH